MSGISKRVSGSWVSGDYGIMKTATDTITTLPADIYANGTTATVGLKGNMVQSGTPSPTTPIQPQECGERTGNLFDYADLEEGYIDINTGENVPNESQKRTQNYITVQANTTYTLSNYDDKCRVHQYSNNSYLGSALTDTFQYSFTTNSNCTRIRISGSKDNFLETTMLNLGSTPLPYEPYGYKIPISSANTTTPIYLGEVQSTRQIRELVLDGTENWAYRSGDPANVFFLYLPTAKTGEVAMSNAYPYYSGTDFVDMNDKEFAIIRSNLAIRNSDYQYESQFKAYLAQQYAAGTPVTIWYVLANPTTGIVNEPLRKIGDYADTVSGITIPTITGKDTFDVNTTLKPSEVTANYHGWHTGAVHERDNGAWD